MITIDGNATIDNDGKPSESFRDEIYFHDLVYDEEHLVSRWTFDELNGSRFRDLGYGRNDGFVVGNAAYLQGNLKMQCHWMGVATI